MVSAQKVLVNVFGEDGYELLIAVLSHIIDAWIEEYAPEYHTNVPRPYLLELLRATISEKIKQFSDQATQNMYLLVHAFVTAIRDRLITQAQIEDLRSSDDDVDILPSPAFSKDTKKTMKPGVEFVKVDPKSIPEDEWLDNYQSMSTRDFVALQFGEDKIFTIKFVVLLILQEIAERIAPQALNITIYKTMKRLQNNIANRILLSSDPMDTNVLGWAYTILELIKVEEGMI